MHIYLGLMLAWASALVSALPQPIVTTSISVNSALAEPLGKKEIMPRAIPDVGTTIAVGPLGACPKDSTEICNTPVDPTHCQCLFTKDDGCPSGTESLCDTLGEDCRCLPRMKITARSIPDAGTTEYIADPRTACPKGSTKICDSPTDPSHCQCLYTEDDGCESGTELLCDGFGENCRCLGRKLARSIPDPGTVDYISDPRADCPRGSTKICDSAADPSHCQCLYTEDDGCESGTELLCDGFGTNCRCLGRKLARSIPDPGTVDYISNPRADCPRGSTKICDSAADPSHCQCLYTEDDGCPSGTELLCDGFGTNCRCLSPKVPDQEEPSANLPRSLIEPGTTIAVEVFGACPRGSTKICDSQSHPSDCQCLFTKDDGCPTSTEELCDGFGNNCHCLSPVITNSGANSTKLSARSIPEAGTTFQIDPLGACPKDSTKICDSVTHPTNCQCLFTKDDGCPVGSEKLCDGFGENCHCLSPKVSTTGKNSTNLARSIPDQGTTIPVDSRGACPKRSTKICDAQDTDCQCLYTEDDGCPSGSQRLCDGFGDNCRCLSPKISARSIPDQGTTVDVEPLGACPKGSTKICDTKAGDATHCECLYTEDDGCPSGSEMLCDGFGNNCRCLSPKNSARSSPAAGTYRAIDPSAVCNTKTESKLCNSAVDPTHCQCVVKDDGCPDGTQELCTSTRYGQNCLCLTPSEPVAEHQACGNGTQKLCSKGYGTCQCVPKVELPSTAVEKRTDANHTHQHSKEKRGILVSDPPYSCNQWMIDKPCYENTFFACEVGKTFAFQSLLKVYQPKNYCACLMCPHFYASAAESPFVDRQTKCPKDQKMYCHRNLGMPEAETDVCVCLTAAEFDQIRAAQATNKRHIPAIVQGETSSIVATSAFSTSSQKVSTTSTSTTSTHEPTAVTGYGVVQLVMKKGLEIFGEQCLSGTTAFCSKTVFNVVDKCQCMTPAEREAVDHNLASALSAAFAFAAGAGPVPPDPHKDVLSKRTPATTSLYKEKIAAERHRLEVKELADAERNAPTLAERLNPILYNPFGAETPCDPDTNKTAIRELARKVTILLDEETIENGTVKLLRGDKKILADFIQACRPSDHGVVQTEQQDQPALAARHVHFKLGPDSDEQ